MPKDNDSDSTDCSEYYKNHQWVLDSSLPTMIGDVSPLPENYGEKPLFQKNLEDLKEKPQPPLRRRFAKNGVVEEPQREFKIIVQQPQSFVSKLSLVLQVYLVFLFTYIVYHLKDNLSVENKIIHYALFS